MLTQKLLLDQPGPFAFGVALVGAVDRIVECPS